MAHRTSVALLLVLSTALGLLVSGCQDPYLEGAKIMLNKPPDELTKSDYQSVIKSLQEAIVNGYPQNFGRYYDKLAQCYYYTGDYSLVKRSLDSATKYLPDLSDSMKIKLDGYWGDQYNKARISVERLIKGSKDSSAALAAAAQKFVDNSMVLRSDKAENYLLLAGIYRATDRIDESKAMYEKAKAIDPNNPDIYGIIGTVAYNSTDWDGAITNLSKAVQLKKDANPLWFYYLGVAHLQKSQFPDAQKAFQQKVALTPDDLPAWFNLGQAFFYEDKDVKGAIQAFEKVLTLKDDDVEALDLLGLSYLNKKVLDYDNAIRIYKKAIEFRPDKIEYWNNLAYSYKQKGMKAEAADVEKRIKSLKK